MECLGTLWRCSRNLLITNTQGLRMTGGFFKADTTLASAMASPLGKLTLAAEELKMVQRFSSIWYPFGSEPRLSCIDPPFLPARELTKVESLTAQVLLPSSKAFVQVFVEKSPPSPNSSSAGRRTHTRESLIFGYSGPFNTWIGGH